MTFWKTLNPPIYLVSLLPIFSVLTLTRGANAGWVVLAGTAVVLLQHGINVMNDVTDWRRGADIEKWDSWVRFHQGNLVVAGRHGKLFAALGLVMGCAAVVAAGKSLLLIVALPLVALGISYNAGENPLSYSAKGEWATGLCYGPGVAGCLYWMALGRMDVAGICLVLGYTLLSLGVLLSHQPSQVLTDTLAGKQTFAVRHGAKKTKRVAQALNVASVTLISGAYVAVLLAEIL